MEKAQQAVFATQIEELRQEISNFQSEQQQTQKQIQTLENTIFSLQTHEKELEEQLLLLDIEQDSPIEVIERNVAIEETASETEEYLAEMQKGFDEFSQINSDTKIDTQELEDELKNIDDLMFNDLSFEPQKNEIKEQEPADDSIQLELEKVQIKNSTLEEMNSAQEILIEALEEKKSRSRIS